MTQATNSGPQVQPAITFNNATNMVSASGQTSRSREARVSSKAESRESRHHDDAARRICKMGLHGPCSQESQHVDKEISNNTIARPQTLRLHKDLGDLLPRSNVQPQSNQRWFCITSPRLQGSKKRSSSVEQTERSRYHNVGTVQRN